MAKFKIMSYINRCTGLRMRGVTKRHHPNITSMTPIFEVSNQMCDIRLLTECGACFVPALVVACWLDLVDLPISGIPCEIHPW